MLNEGIVGNDSTVQIKSEIIRQLHDQQQTTPDRLEKAVFTALTGSGRDDVDWQSDENQAGYYLWIKSFDALLKELVDDGDVLVETGESGRTLAAAAGS